MSSFPWVDRAFRPYGSGLRSSFGVRVGGCLFLLLALGAPMEAQLSYTRGQTVSPAFEGWEANEDGTFSLLFGYMNRNWEEELDVPVGAENYFSPGPQDRGQPTHFLPRRNRFTFKVVVPADFGDQELVWAVTTQGETEYAYASLRPDYLIDNVVIQSETGALGAGTSSPEVRANLPPGIVLEGEPVRRAVVGQPVRLVAQVSDDGIPRVRQATFTEELQAEREAQGLFLTDAASRARLLRPPTRITVNKNLGLHFAWFVYRGEGAVDFSPIQVKTWEDTRAGSNSPWAPLWTAPPLPEDGRWVADVTFQEPGRYVLQGRADDGGLYSDVQVVIEVAPLLP